LKDFSELVPTVQEGGTSHPADTTAAQPSAGRAHCCSSGAGRADQLLIELTAAVQEQVELTSYIYNSLLQFRSR
jgi:hypothetical protein